MDKKVLVIYLSAEDDHIVTTTIQAVIEIPASTNKEEIRQFVSQNYNDYAQYEVIELYKANLVQRNVLDFE